MTWKWLPAVAMLMLLCRAVAREMRWLDMQDD